MVINEVPSELDAERYAGLIFAHRESILDSWCDLIQVDAAEPASEFIRDQLDASLLALANWFLGTDPAESTMGLQWSGIERTAEMTVGAVVAMSLLPEAVRPSITTLSEDDHSLMMRKISEFTGAMTHRLLSSVNVEFEDERWDQVARDVQAWYEEQRVQRVRRLGVLIEIAHAVSASQDLDTLFEKVQKSVIQLSGSDYTEISLLEPVSGMLRCHLVYADGQRQPHLERTMIEQGLANEVLRTGQALVVSDYETACDERGIPTSAALPRGTQRGWMAAPMRRGDEIAGVISVAGRLTSYEPEDVELLTAIARQTAVALDNRRLIEAQQRHVAQLSAVNHLAREMAQLREAGELVQVAAARIRDFFEFGLVTVFIVPPRSNRLVMQARSPIPVDAEAEARSLKIGPDSVVGEVAYRKAAALHADVNAVETYLGTRSTRNTRSEMAVPIVHSGTLLGVLDVQSDRVNAFDRHDLTTLQTIADQLSIGLENCRLFEEEAQRSRELRLMLETTRASSSSLLLDQVLERLAEGLAYAVRTSTCVIYLYDPEDRCFSPATLVGSAEVADDCLCNEWDRMLATDHYPELEQALNDPFPQLICSFGRYSGGPRVAPAMFLVPLRTRHRTLGIAVIPADDSAGTCCPVEQMRLLQGVADSGALAVENARLYARAHGLAIAEERGRQAQEIHDTLAQGLTAISLQLDLADSYLPDNPEKAASNVRRALELTRENLEQARRSVLDLRAADVHQMSLPDAISQLLRRLGDESEMNFEFVNRGLTSRLSARVEVGLYRILEEALENARRHSEASRVQVEIVADGRTVAALVEDNGLGFDPHDTAGRNGTEQGFGLLGIRERARLLGGILTVASEPGNGTRVRIVVPYEARVQSTSKESRDVGGLA